MPTSDSTRPGTPQPNDAAKKAGREQTSAPQLAVQQHNPRDLGLNPGQRGPAQPRGEADDTAS